MLFYGENHPKPKDVTANASPLDDFCPMIKRSTGICNLATYGLNRHVLMSKWVGGHTAAFDNDSGSGSMSDTAHIVG